ncbi:MAG: aldehyde ferredoxin oxidoreductase family protein [Thermoflexales bacterium]|nr:aldehyde ferredoxin oxidoreductase family protein [Thermoflexales bacterium]
MNALLLFVDLNRGEVRTEALDPAVQRDFIGGSGLAASLLWDRLDPACAPLDPASPMLWMTGPLTGLGGPATGRFSICARSPQTGLWGESNIGGFVGPQLRQAGYEGVLITGRANVPVYLWVHSGGAELRDAGHLWGKADSYQTQRLIRDELGQARARVACIGPAGENQVPYASIIADHGRAAGRTGLGAVMGSKQLKALAVHSVGQVPCAQPAECKRLCAELNQSLREANLTAMFHEVGTAGAAEYLQMLGDMPQKYWTQATFENASAISGSTMAETILTGKRACQGCAIACGREVTIETGPYATAGAVKGPEYETLAVFGPQLLVDDLHVITALGQRCDELGLDTISAGSALGLAYLMFERGLISAADTGGLELRWGDARPCFDLLHQLAQREGFGVLLAQGSRSLAAHFGAEELAVHVNNLDVPMHDPRAMTGQALAYLTSPRGACHNQGDYFLVEMGNSIDDLDIPMTERLEDGGKAHHVARHQDWRTACNSLVMCFFAAVSPSAIAPLLAAATGHEWRLDDMLLAGERAWNLKRLYNCRLGLTRQSEKLPHLLRQALPDGGQLGHVPDEALLLQEYYAARGWDLATGQPTPHKLASLGLDVNLDTDLHG